MLYAKTAPDMFLVERVEALPDGDNCAILRIPYEGDYDAYRTMPKVVTINGVLYACTGWNSDRGEAYYKRSAGKKIALAAK